MTHDELDFSESVNNSTWYLYLAKAGPEDEFLSKHGVVAFLKESKPIDDSMIGIPINECGESVKILFEDAIINRGIEMFKMIAKTGDVLVLGPPPGWADNDDEWICKKED